MFYNFGFGKAVSLQKKTCNHFYIRAAELMGMSNQTEKCFKNVKQFAISDYLVNWVIIFDGLDILATDSNTFKLFIRETLLIKLDITISKRTTKSFSSWSRSSNGNYFFLLSYIGMSHFVNDAFRVISSISLADI